MKIKHLAFFLPVIITILFFPLPAGGQDLSQIVYDTYGITGFEVAGNLVYYWKSGGNCAGTPVNAYIRIVPSNPCTLWYYTASDCSFMEQHANGPARDAAYFYLPVGKAIMRVPLNADSQSVSPSHLPNPLSAEVSGRIQHVSGRLYWWSQISPTLARIFSANVDGSDFRAEVTCDGGAQSIGILQFYVYTYLDASHVPHPAIFYITSQKHLYRHEMIDAPNVSTFLSYDVYYVKPQRMPDGTDKLFCLKQATIDRAEPYAHVWRMDPVNGTGGTIYTSPLASSLESLDTDSSRVFWVENTHAAEPEINIYIKRKSLTAAFADPADNVYSVRSSDVSNVRSDGVSVYWRNVDEIWKTSASAQGMRLDLRAVDLEAVQYMQRLNPSPDVPLIAGKTTFVRAYAEQLINDYPDLIFHPGARLHGYIGTTELIGSPLSPLNDPAVTAQTGPQYTRGDANRSFLFRLPDGWVHAGPLRLSFVVNPLWMAPEPAAFRGNNAVERTFNIETKGQPCLVFMPVRVVGASNMSFSQVPNMAGILHRAATLLPVKPPFRTYTQSDDIAELVFPWRYEGYDFPDDASYANFSIWMRDQTSSDPAGCERTHWVGIVNPNVPSFNGIGLVDGDSICFRAAGGQNPSVHEPWYAPNLPLGGRTLAHEMGHNYDRAHIACSDSATPPDQPYNWDYPYDSCHVGFPGWDQYWGFDPISRTVIAPTTDDVGDLMSYRNRRWPSDYTWNAIKAEAPNSPARGDFTETILSAAEMKIIGASPQILVAGMIDTKSAKMQTGPFILFPAGTAPSEKVLRAHSDAKQLRQKSDASYNIRLVDGGGTVLAESPLVTKDIMDDESSEIVGFGQYVGFVEGTASIRFLSGLDILDERFVSAHAPVLTLGPVSLDSDSLGLRWSATDEDGDSLHYTVQYSSDDGVHYSTLVSGYPFTQFRTRAEVLAGSENARLRVIASDGVLSDVEATPAFNMPRHSPVVSIGGVRNGDRLPYGSSLNLFSTAMDPEDGNIAEGYLSWNAAYNYLPYSSSGGSAFHLDSPEPGLFFVDLAATDSDGNSASEHVSFEILPLVVPDGPAVPVLDGTATGDEYAGATEVRIPLGDGAFATARLLHCGGRLCLLINNLKTGSGTQATFTGIRIDPNASGDTFAMSDDRGFFVNENSILSMAGGDGMGDMPILSDPPAGFEVAVLNGGEAWSAELQINESLINDWNHLARVKLGQYWITGVGDDRNWPAWSIWNSPASWATAWFGPSLPAQPNQAPVANAGSDRSAMTSTDISITLGGDGSYDPDGDPITYAWTQTEGPSVVFDDAASPTPTFTLSPPADSVTLRFSLTVNDGQENSPPDEVEVVIFGAPSPMFVPSVTSGWAPMTVCFTNYSTPNGHDITAYQWDFEGDGVMDSYVENPPCFKYERPGTYNPTIYITTDLGSNSMSQRIIVKYLYPFDNADTEGWESHPVAGGTYINDPLGAFYMAQTTTANPSEVGILNSPGNNVFGSWQQKVAAPMTDCGDGYLFRARYYLRTTQTDSAAVPQVRMRWNDASSLTFNMFVADRGFNALGTSLTPYDLYYFKSAADSVVGQDFLAAWDLVDFTPQQSGDISCDSIEVTRHAAPTAGETLIWDQNSTADFNPWTTFGAPGILDQASSGRGDGSLWLETPGPAGTYSLYYGGWSSVMGAGSPRFEAGYLYKAVFTLRSESEAARQNLPTIRLRVSNQTFNWSAMKSVRQIPGTVSHMPGTAGTDYFIYLPAPTTLIGGATEPNDLMVMNFDLVDSGAAEYGRVYLDRVRIYRYTMP